MYLEIAGKTYSSTSRLVALCDRWMKNGDDEVSWDMQKWSHEAGKGHPVGRSYDAFVNAMWAAYRDKVPVQPNGKDNLKWVWTDTNLINGYGRFVPNPNESAEITAPIAGKEKLGQAGHENSIVARR